MLSRCSRTISAGCPIIRSIIPVADQLALVVIQRAVVLAAVIPDGAGRAVERARFGRGGVNPSHAVTTAAAGIAIVPFGVGVGVSSIDTAEVPATNK
jgi:hypothetical protein